MPDCVGEGVAGLPPLAGEGVASLLVVVVAGGTASMAGKAVVVQVGLLPPAAEAPLEPTQ